MTLSKLLGASWLPAADSCLVRNSIWQQALRDGTIRLEVLGVTVECNGQLFPVEEVITPVVWAHSDEVRAGADLVNLAESLVRSAIEAHLDMLLEAVPSTGLLAVSKSCHFRFGEPTTRENGRIAYVYTACSRITNVKRSPRVET